jgi:TIR domain-containing protein
MPAAPFLVFYSYSHADVRMLDRLRTHLAMLRRHGLITEWYDRDIEAGAQWRDEIAAQLDAADVILLLVSADFLASDFCFEDEMTRAVERADRGEVTLIGVMLRPVDGWQETPFARFQMVPQDARPITTWSNADTAYSSAAKSIRLAEEVTALFVDTLDRVYGVRLDRPLEIDVSWA